MSDTEEDVGVLIAAKDAALKPVKAAISPTARRAYLSTALFVSTAFFLLGLAIVAYITFYLYYIPIRGFTQPIHFQFADPSADPRAIVYPPPSSLVSDQPYDIKVFLNLPRSYSNVHRGNFMVDVQLLSPVIQGSQDVIAHSSRPTMLTYHSPPMEYVHKAIFLPFYMLGLRKESEALAVPVMEGMVFPKGWKNTPSSIKVQLLNAAQLQIYDASISFKVKLRGLRYLMYNWRLSSFVVFTSAFWGFELASMAIFWLSLSMILSSEPTVEVKQEKQDPLSIKQEPVATSEETSVKIKQEEDESTVQEYPAATEADVEDEEEPEPPVIINNPYRGAASDSGIGTSLESSASKGESIRKRSSRSNFRDDR